MDFLHIDVWVAAGTDRLLKVSPLNNATGGTGAAEVLVNVPLTPGSWNSIDIPKSDFTGMTWTMFSSLSLMVSSMGTDQRTQQVTMST